MRTAERSACATGDERPDGAGLDGLSVVDAMSGEGEVLEAVALVELEEIGGDALGVLEVRVLRHPVVALLCAAGVRDRADTREPVRL